MLDAFGMLNCNDLKFWFCRFHMLQKFIINKQIFKMSIKHYLELHIALMICRLDLRVIDCCVNYQVPLKSYLIT